MNKLTIVKPPIAQYVDQVHALASKYHTDWLDLYVNVRDGKHDMSPTDRDDFDFLCTAFWDQLVSDVVQEDDHNQHSREYERDHAPMFAEPGVSPGSCLHAA